MNSTSAWWNHPLFEGVAVTPLRLASGLLVLVVCLLLARWIGRWLGRRAAGNRLDPGARYAIERLLQYGFLVASVVASLAVVGVDLRSVAVVAGALGIGIGLGLQSVTANVVSGLILLFERPIQPGDRISLGTKGADVTGEVNGYVRAIRLRSTTIATPDNILLIVPNADLLGQTIVNWSHGDPRMRIRLDVGVAYASDLGRVREAMLAAAAAHPVTMKEPPPEARLVKTGDSALEFQLLVWIPDPRERGRIESDLRLDIVERFREAGVTIPFPQREVRVLGDGPFSHRAAGA